MLGRLYKRILDRLRSNDRWTRRIWGIEVHRKLIPFTWDVTSLCMKKAIDLSLPAGPFRFLDMGCGHLALLGQYAKLRRPDAEVVSVDLYPEFAENARLNARQNGSAIEVRQSDLFAAVPGRFDVLAFNPPYRPTGSVPASETGIDYPATAFSGEDGGDATRSFLRDAHDHVTASGRVLLGVNCFYLPEERCRELIEQAGWTLEATVRRRLNTARVFRLRPRDPLPL